MIDSFSKENLIKEAQIVGATFLCAMLKAIHSFLLDKPGDG